MMDDQTLLARFIASRDAAAFEELTHRYTGLVKGVCVHVLGNPHDAEEVAQECFFELARHAPEIHTSIGGWLHRTATSRSLNALRSRARRKVRERLVGADAETVVPAADLTKPDLHRLINGALTEMPDELRVPMMLHFFDGRSQRDVAVELGVNQSTVSRRMQDALKQLREKLTQAGYAAAAPAMMAMMQDHAAASESGRLRAESAEKVVAGMTLAGAVKGVATALLPVLSVLLLGGWISLLLALGVALCVLRHQPAWFSELMASLGVRSVYEQPTFFLRRWVWTSPPQRWQRNVCVSLAQSIFVFGLAWLFAVGTPQPPWGTVVLGVIIASGHFIHAVRLMYRVKFVCRPIPQIGNVVSVRERNTDGPFWQRVVGLARDDSTLNWWDVAQLISIGAAAVSLAISVTIHPETRAIWPAVVLSGGIGAGMFISGVGLSHLLIIRRRNGTRFEITSTEPINRKIGTHRLLASGTAVVVLLSIWIAANPFTVRSHSLSLAAVQTSILGWMFYRLAAYSHTIESRVVRRVTLAVLAGSFLLNSGVCLANWLR